MPQSTAGTNNWPNGNGLPPSPDTNGNLPGGSDSPSVSGGPGGWQNPGGVNGPIATAAPGGWPTDSSCGLQDTTTVFVTVLPSATAETVPTDGNPSDGSSTGNSSPDNSSPDGSSPDGSSPDGSSPDGSSPNGSADGSAPSDNSSGNTSPSGPSGDGSTSGNPSDSAPPYGSPGGSAPDDSSPNGNLPGDSIPSGSQPGDAGSGNPEDSGQSAPDGSASSGPSQGTGGSVEPFTTLTIDIWGTRGAPDASASDSSPQATSADSGVVTDGPAPAPSSSTSQPGEGSVGVPPSSGGSTTPGSGLPGDTSGNGPLPGSDGSPGGNADPNTGNPSPGDSSTSPAGNDPSSNDNSNSGEGSYGNPDDSPIFVSDGQPSPSWPGQGSPPSPQITSPSDGSSAPSGSSGNANENGADENAPYSVTIMGPDGQPTVVSHPWGHDPGSSGLPASTDVYASGTDAQSLPYPASLSVNAPGPAITGPGAPNGAGFPNSGDSGVVTCITVLGDDGKPTVVDFTGNVPGPVATAGPMSQTAVTDGSALAQSLTIIGADGKPTVISSPWGNGAAPGGSGPAVTDAPGSNGSGTGGGNSGGGAGTQAPVSPTSCITILGSDGKPTVVDWPWDGSSLATSAPFPNGPGSNGNGNGGVLTDGSTLPQGPMTHASFTILGPDGLPTVVETNWPSSPTDASGGSGSPQGPVVSQASISGLPSGVSAQLPLPSGPVPGGNPGAGNDPTDCITIIGSDGKPTIIEATGAVPGATGGPVVGPGATLPLPLSSGVPALPLPPFPDTASAASAGEAGDSPVNAAFTTCTSYTILGADGLPTIVDTTWVVPPTFETGSALATDRPGPNSAPAGQVTSVPGWPNPDGNGPITTCSTYTVIGADGRPSAVETTYVVPAQASGALATDAQLTSGIQAAPWSAGPIGPAPPSANGAGFPENQGPGGPLTTCITVMTPGADGILTPTEQTVILPPSASVGSPSAVSDGSALPLTTVGLPNSSPTGPVIGNGPAPGNNGGPNMSDYGGGAANGDAGTIAPPGGTGLPGASVDPLTAGEPTITVTGHFTSTLTVFADPTGGPIVSGPSGLPIPDYGAGDNQGEPLPVSARPASEASGADPSEETLFPASDMAYGGGGGEAGVPVTSTWSNAIPQGTTTYLLKFPLTTMATLPARRNLKRQSSNSTTSAPGDETTSLPLPTIASPTKSEPAPSMCASGGNIGNRTVTFDSDKPGPLFNPTNDLWFSEGFLIAPPSSQSQQAYFASSGGQLVEFVPASLIPNGAEESSDVAEIGVGPNASKDCYRFDLFGASLGCAAQGAEDWCEFEISAYRWNPKSSREESIAWSETKRVPACAGFPDGACALTPITLDGYTNITGVLITLRVGLDLRAWWGDDFRYGWTDNSCEAAVCRGSVTTHRVKRETVDSALRRGVWHWTPEGVERLDDDLIWDAVL